MSIAASTSLTTGPLRDLEALGQSVFGFDNTRSALQTSGELSGWRARIA